MLQDGSACGNTLLATAGGRGARLPPVSAAVRHVPSWPWRSLWSVHCAQARPGPAGRGGDECQHSPQQVVRNSVSPRPVDRRRVSGTQKVHSSVTGDL